MVVVAMKLIRQPRYSNTCGHAVVAMLAGTTVPRVAAVLAHDRPTTWRELYSVLFAFGVVCGPVLVPSFEEEDMPGTCVVQVPSDSPAIKHWVLKHGPDVYDPAVGVYPACTLPYTRYPATRVLQCADVRSRKV